MLNYFSLKKTGAFWRTVSVALVAGAATGSAMASDWKPTQAVEYIAPANPGGGWDTLARISSRVIQEEKLSTQNFAVINVPGGGGAVAWAQMAAKKGNPHTLFVTSPPIILVPLSGASRFSHKDFTPIARLITDYSILLVRADAPYKTAKDLFDAIKAKPGLSVGGGSAPGSMDHIAVAGAAAAVGLSPAKLNYIAFSGGGEATTNLMGGHVQAVITGAGEAVAQLKGGRVRALAVSAPIRMPSLPDVPTYQEQGIDFTFDIWRGVMGPANMSKEAVLYYQDLYARMLKTEGWAKARDQLGWIDAYQDSAAFGTFLNGQSEEFSSVLKDMGLVRN